MMASINWVTGMGKMSVNVYLLVYTRLFQERLLQGR